MAANIDADPQDELVIWGGTDTYIVELSPEGIPQETITLPEAVSDAYVVDVNNDGNQDLVLGGFFQFTVRLGDGTGQFGEEVSFTYGQGSAFQDQGKILLHDVNGDSFVDIIAATPDAAFTYENIGDGIFEVTSTFNFPEPTRILNLLDINQDGQLDLVGRNDTLVVSASRRILSWPLEDDGSLGDEMGELVASGDVLSVQTADLNADDLPDLIVTHRRGFHDDSRGGTSVYLSLQRTAWRIPQLVNAGTLIHISDLDEGQIEFFGLDFNGLIEIQVRPNTYFDQQVSLLEADTESIATDFFVVDTNADGANERLTYNTPSSSVQILDGKSDALLSRSFRKLWFRAMIRSARDRPENPGHNKRCHIKR